VTKRPRADSLPVLVPAAGVSDAVRRTELSRQVREYSSGATPPMPTMASSTVEPYRASGAEALGTPAEQPLPKAFFAVRIAEPLRGQAESVKQPPHLPCFRFSGAHRTLRVRMSMMTFCVRGQRSVLNFLSLSIAARVGSMHVEPFRSSVMCTLPGLQTLVRCSTAYIARAAACSSSARTRALEIAGRLAPPHPTPEP
jgi:hypothetical protein